MTKDATDNVEIVTLRVFFSQLHNHLEALMCSGSVMPVIDVAAGRAKVRFCLSKCLNVIAASGRVDQGDRLDADLVAAALLAKFYDHPRTRRILNSAQHSYEISTGMIIDVTGVDMFHRNG